MSVLRPMGTETEYAISLAGARNGNPVRLCFDVVGHAVGKERRHIRWDYRQEDPVNDARGHRLERAAARPDMLTDEPQLRVTNTIAPNGGRIYVDHAHPEYSAPETCDPFEAVRYDRAGDLLMWRAALAAAHDGCGELRLHRNNVDGKGASWGSHENHLLLRAVPFERVAALMTAQFVSRQIYAGSGRVGLGERSEREGFQLSQRADYVRTRIGLQTTFDRPIVNTRDEPHSSGAYRRLHGIVGDANRMDVPQALKMGVTSLLLWLLEAELTGAVSLEGLLDEVAVHDPVRAMHVVSRDLTLAQALSMSSGGRCDAWGIQMRLYEEVRHAGTVVYGTDGGEPAWPDEPTMRTMLLWEQVLRDVREVRGADADARLGMADQARRLEWLLKWQILEGMRRKVGAGWGDPRMAVLDLQWAALDPSRSVFARVSDRSQSLCSVEQVEEACEYPPEGTRAWLRAELVRRHAKDVVAVSWSRISVRDSHASGVVVGLDMSDPLAGARSPLLEQVLDTSCDAARIVRRLADIIGTGYHGDDGADGDERG